MGRQLGVLAILGAFTIVAFGGLTRAVSASCPAPDITVGPARGPSGTHVTISGRHWAVGCNDTNVGCTRRPSQDPYRAIQLSIRPAAGGTAMPLGRLDADNDTFAFDLSVILATPPGHYVIVARATDPRSSPAEAPITITP
jgi:hypothetical protein